MFFISSSSRYSVKEKLSLGLINSALRREDVWGGGGIAPPFLTLVLNEGEWSDSHSCRLTPGETTPCTNFTGGWVGPKAGLDVMEKRKLLIPIGNRTPAHRSSSP
jgi:hypothetical protein